jgi:hypothetical protein
LKERAAKRYSDQHWAIGGVLLVQIDWVKETPDRWFRLDFVDLAKINTHGVFVIWKPGVARITPSVTILVGHGDVASTLLKARHDVAVGKHGRDLLVTWAAVDVLYVAGVEAYLVQQLRPLMGRKLPLASVHAVNIPLVA